jgi:hypothetical protein
VLKNRPIRANGEMVKTERDVLVAVARNTLTRPGICYHPHQEPKKRFSQLNSDFIFTTSPFCRKPLKNKAQTMVKTQKSIFTMSSPLHHRGLAVFGLVLLP